LAGVKFSLQLVDFTPPLSQIPQVQFVFGLSPSVSYAVQEQWMKQNRQRTKDSPRLASLAVVCGIVLFILLTVTVPGLMRVRKQRVKQPASEETYHPLLKGELTFARHIAPILFENCTTCHRPGQSAPFSLLSYADTKKRARDIVRVTEERYMPPWLPEAGYGHFIGTRRLSVQQIGMLKQWLEEGLPEGDSAAVPPAPPFPGDWQLGPPDLIVTSPKAYTLSADGRDVYRNFVLPLSIDQTRFVRAVEFNPGNARVVHHAFVKVDRTQESRYLDAKDPEPGFPGLIVPAEIPNGHFLGWQPGRRPSPLPEGLQFKLDPGNDFVIQMHLNPIGRAEQVQPSLGLYFTDKPPTNTCFRVALTSFVIEIPPGATNYTVEDTFTLPVDVHALAVLPHAHYLAGEIEGWAVKPDGTREPLIWIRKWDFNWQSDYRYAEPLFLPRGTTLSMRISYDNSVANPRNPNQPPKLVSYGPQSSDEMAELWLQLLPKKSADLTTLSRAYDAKSKERLYAKSSHEIQKRPNDPKANAEIGLMKLGQGKVAEAEKHFETAIKTDSQYALGHYYYGVLLRQKNLLKAARQEFELVTQLEPQNGKAHGNLAFVLLDLGDTAGARRHLEEAVKLNPFDQLAKQALAELTQTNARP
jgi:hypothetical protein